MLHRAGTHPRRCGRDRPAGCWGFLVWAASRFGPRQPWRQALIFRSSARSRRRPVRSAIWRCWCSPSPALIFLVVEGVLFYCTWRFRRGRGSDGIEPPQVYGSKPIEIAWTAAPALIVFILVLVTIAHAVGSRDSPAQAPGGRQGPVRHRDRPSMVVGISSYEHYNGRQLGFHHRQRTARAGQRRQGERGPSI